jgi:lipopolysaccharide transport system ATP-binding protein
MSIIEVNNVVKEFRLGQMTNLKQSLLHALSRLRGRPSSRRPPFKALDGVDFKVEEGEVLGIIGTNGAGKSTLLKLLARITVPTSGSVRVGGSIAPLIEVGAGLIGDLSGRENIYLNAAILGMRRAEIKKKFDDIVAFAELEEFIDTPIKRYSSGMAVRLGFSIATSVQADILIVDEVLAVGDLAFQRKCFDRMEDMIKRQGKTVLIVSHNTRQVERLCSRVILLDHGHVIADGEPEKVCQLFYERSDAKIKLLSKADAAARSSNTLVTNDVQLIDISLLDSLGNTTDVIPYKVDIAVRVRVAVKKELKVPTFGVGVHTTDFLYLTTHNSESQLTLETLAPGEYEIVCRVRECPLLPGVYALRLGISEGIASRGVFYGENLLHFQVTANPSEPISDANRHGFFALDATWADPEVKSVERRSFSVEKVRAIS